MYDEEQAEQIERVSERIAAVVMEFFKRPDRRFYADELRSFIAAKIGLVAPGSPDRIMRDLRQKGRIDYRVVNRSESLYEILAK